MTASTVLASKERIHNQPLPTLLEKPASGYNVSVGYLRAFITLMVVAHHAALAYHPFAPEAPASLTALPRWWQAFPVVDPKRWTGFAALVGFNDTFFMSLMFLLSGLFVWKSLQGKGAAQFVRERAVRLGVPFLAAAAVIAPLAYYPSYLQTGASGIAGFWRQWFALGNWPAGPAWFVWVLLAFDCIAAGLFLLAPRSGDALGRLASGAERRPILFFGAVLGLSAIAYLPLELLFNGFRWSAWGPFTFQTSRGLHYLAYFLLGTGVGAYGLDRGLLAAGGKLARRWWLWSLGALVAFAISAGVGLAAMTAHLGSRGWEVGADLGFVLACAAISFAFLAMFVRFARTRRPVFDSLTVNAYGIYLIHYAFVSWLQYAVLKSQMPAIAKGSFVLLAAVLLSWGATAALRRIPAVARVI